MLDVLQAFNLPPDVLNAVRTLYNGAETRVKVNGTLSPPFPNTSGVKQGCPLLGILYILTQEVQLHMIRTDPAIRGIPIPGPDGTIPTSAMRLPSSGHTLTERGLTTNATTTKNPTSPASLPGSRTVARDAGTTRLPPTTTYRTTTTPWQARGRSSSRACCIAVGCAASRHHAPWQPPSRPRATSLAKRSGRGESSLIALACSCARHSGMRSMARHCSAGTHSYTTGCHRRRWGGSSSGTTPRLRRWPSLPSWLAPRPVQGASRGSGCGRSYGRQYVRTARSSRQRSL